ncbi:MAG: formate dehydrogenase subunit alpha [Bacteroidales bacterium]|jgi:formate dehydrogenase alpha subunit|nr:formate dehydrogenase subunit alpha [Bacteroidales bacterium]
MMSNYINIYIDNKKIRVSKGTNLLRAALDNEIEIPNLCYHKKLSPTGACRLCIVKIEGQKELIPSCTVEVGEGMKVTAFDNEIDEYRRNILDYLLSEHNEEYDGTYNDSFRDLIFRYKLDNRENRKSESLIDILDFHNDFSSEVLSYDASKCIKCNICIKACDEVQGKSVLSMSERGINSHIIAGLDNWGESECDACGECVQLCPTGALVEKLNRDFIDLEKIDRKIKTTCPYCGVGCQMEILVQNEKIVRVNGVEGILPNDGRLCVKGRFGYQFIQSPDRLKKPLIKKNGSFVESEWTEAIKLIASKFNDIKNKYGSDAIGGFASAKCSNEDNYIFQRFMRGVIGTNNIDNCARLCHASTVAAVINAFGGGTGTNSIEDYAKADCIYVTGNNIVDTHPVTATYIKQGKRSGAKIIVVDPKFTPLVSDADVWLQPKIGTDVALLNGLIHIIIRDGLIDKKFIETRVQNSWESFNELKELTNKYTPEFVEKITTVPVSKLNKAAHIYGNSKKAMIATGMGMSQEVTGVNNVYSLVNMCLITGNIGKKGAGINPPRGQNNVQGVSDVGCMPNTYPAYISVADKNHRKFIAEKWNIDEKQLSNKFGLTSVEMMQAASKGEIKAMYIMGENPLISDPNLSHIDKALNKLDFLVVQDIFHNDTTPYADVILPATSFAEKDGTFTNSDRRINRIRKLVDAPGESLPDWEIISMIENEMKSQMPQLQNASEIFDELASVMPSYRGVNWKRIEHEGIQWPCPTKNHPGTDTVFLDKFNTESGKAIINPIEYRQQSEKSSKEYPLILNSGRLLYHYHTSTLSGRSDVLNHFAPTHFVLVNPINAEKMNLGEGTNVKLSSKQGSLNTIVKISNDVAEGEVFMPWHYNDAKVNMLTRDELDPISKIPPYKLTAVKIEHI